MKRQIERKVGKKLAGRAMGVGATSGTHWEVTLGVALSLRDRV